MKNIEIVNKNRDILSNFYQVLKAIDKYLKFIFLTGASKLGESKISLG